MMSVLDKYGMMQKQEFQVFFMDLLVNASDLSQQQNFKAVVLDRFLFLTL
jgi:hypothetical protein